MEYLPTTYSALYFNNFNALDEWLNQYLIKDANATIISEEILSYKDHCLFGPIRFPLFLFTRNCGPEPCMMYKEDYVKFEHRVKLLKNKYSQDIDLPPLLLHYDNNVLELYDGAHRYEACRRLSFHYANVIIWTKSLDSLNEFKDKYTSYYSNII